MPKNCRFITVVDLSLFNHHKMSNPTASDIGKSIPFQDDNPNAKDKHVAEEVEERSVELQKKNNTSDNEIDTEVKDGEDDKSDENRLTDKLEHPDAATDRAGGMTKDAEIVGNTPSASAQHVFDEKNSCFGSRKISKFLGDDNISVYHTVVALLKTRVPLVHCNLE